MSKSWEVPKTDETLTKRLVTLMEDCVEAGLKLEPCLIRARKEYVRKIEAKLKQQEEEDE